MLPSIFGESMFDDWMGFPFRTADNADRHVNGAAAGLMKTDITERENEYELSVELPGYKKDQIDLQLNDGYLTITAVRSSDSESAGENGRVIRRERYTGSARRTFRVGANLREEDVKARFENGVLTLVFPKEDARKAEPRRAIQIQG